MELVGYIRVSTEEQRDNSSLGEQTHRLRSYCAAYGHKLVRIYEDVGSGRDTRHREAYNQAVKALVNNQADGLVVTSLDRLARRALDLLKLAEEVIDPHQKALVILDLGIDTSTPIGRCMLTNMAAVAELERKLIAKRTLDGRRAKAEAGGYAHGAPPFGYRAQNGELVLSEREQECISVIVMLWGSGWGVRQIAKYLTVSGLTTKKGKMWRAEQVSRILARTQIQDLTGRPLPRCQKA